MFLRKSVITCSLITFLGTGLFIMTSSFRNPGHIHDLVQQTQSGLNQHYDADQNPEKIKKIELTITDDGFLRYRKYLPNGKQEYYSLNLLRFNDLDYMGNTSGTLIFRTLDEDVIMQTYNDPKGNIDSMAFQMSFPVRQIEPEDLLSLRENLLAIKKELQD